VNDVLKEPHFTQNDLNDAPPLCYRIENK